MFQCARRWTDVATVQTNVNSSSVRLLLRSHVSCAFAIRIEWTWTVLAAWGRVVHIHMRSRECFIGANDECRTTTRKQWACGSHVLAYLHKRVNIRWGWMPFKQHGHVVRVISAMGLWIVDCSFVNFNSRWMLLSFELSSFLFLVALNASLTTNKTKTKKVETKYIYLAFYSIVRCAIVNEYANKNTIWRIYEL